MRFLLKGGALGSALLVAACGGGGSDSPSTSAAATPSLISADEEVMRLFSDTAGDIADVIASGGVPLVAREVSEASWREDFGGGGSHTPIDGALSIEGDGNDLLVTIGEKGGPSYVYRIVNAAAINDSEFRFSAPGGGSFFMFISGSVTFADLFDAGAPSGFVRRMQVFYSPPGEDFGLESRVVMGTETRDSVISDLAGLNATATYNGRANVAIRDAGLGFPQFNGFLTGNLDMTADFGRRKVSGVVNDLTLELDGTSVTPSVTNPAGAIALDETDIVQNAFSGGMTPDAALQASNSDLAAFADSGTYSGAFYGPNAEEIGGTMTLDANVNGTRFLGIGNFDGR